MANGSSPASWGAVYEELRLAVLARLADRAVGPSDRTHQRMVETEIDAVLAEHQRSFAVGLSTDGSLHQRVRERLLRTVIDYGPLTPFLAPVTIANEVLIASGEISYMADSRLVVHPETCHPNEMLHHVRRLLGDAGFTIDAAHPQVRCMVLGGTARLTVTIPPVSPAGLDVHMRRYSTSTSTLREWVARDSLTVPAAQFLALNMRAQTRGAIGGPPSAGKTSLANGMLRHVPSTMVTRVLQDVPELQTTHLTPDRPWTAHPGGPDGTGSRSLRQLGEAGLQAAPGMFVLGETKGPEAFLITRLANAGCGFLTTTHANSARMAMESLVETALMAGENISDAAMMRSFARIIHYVVFCDLEPLHLVPTGGRQRRQVMEIAVVTPFSTVDSGFHLDALFRRDGFGEPLQYLGHPDLPDDLDRLLRRALPRGVTLRDVLEGRSQESY